MRTKENAERIARFVAKVTGVPATEAATAVDVLDELKAGTQARHEETIEALMAIASAIEGLTDAVRRR